MNKNKIQLAIIKANGFSTSKITLCMSLIPMMVAILGGGLGYILSIIFQQGLFSIISSYIFLSVNFFTFNIGILIGIIALVILLLTLFVFINLKILFKKPIALTINQTIEVKNN
ncbi:MAG: FtsX-like permease family protein, partial [Bacilli bacterium]